MSPSAKTSVGEALVEYLVLVLPVAIYVGLESYHKHEFAYFYESPEWAIATVFLQFQGAYLFIKHSTKRRAGKLSEWRVTLLSLVALMIVVASAMNALDSMHEESKEKVAFRAALFFFTTIQFLVLVAASKYNNQHSRPG